MKIVLAVFISLSIIFLSGCSQGSNTQPGTSQATSVQTGTAPGSAAPGTGSTNQGTASQRVFTADELKKYDGQNGHPAYVAVDGIVYDVTKSNRWRNGAHQGCSTAGYDLTDTLNSEAPHGIEMLKRMPVVGTYKK